MAYAVLQTGGKQYRVTQGEWIDVEKIDAEPGAEITFSDLLLVGEGSNLKVGAAVKGVSVVAEVVDQIKAPKVIAFKYRRRKGYHRTVGHRQRLTRLFIKAINS